MTRAFTNAGPLLLISSITSSSASFNAFLSWHKTCLHWALVSSTACSFASSNGKVGAQQPLPPHSWEQQSCWGSRGRMESSRKHPSAWKKSFTSCSQCNLPSIVKNDCVVSLRLFQLFQPLDVGLGWNGLGQALIYNKPNIRRVFSHKKCCGGHNKSFHSWTLELLHNSVFTTSPGVRVVNSN